METMLRKTSEEMFLTRVEEHASIIRAVTRTYCRSAEDRQDLEQEIRMQLWRAFPKFDGRYAFSTWMYRIALNVAISLVRVSSRKNLPSEPLHEETQGVTQIQPDDRAEWIVQFMESLDEMNRALMMLYLEEQSYADIATILGITETNVATKISRLKQKIRNEYAQSQKEEGNGTR